MMEVVDLERKCERCGKVNCVLMGMEPGKDAVPWFLCVKCWLEGTKKPEPPTLEEVKPPKESRTRQRTKGQRHN